MLPHLDKILDEDLAGRWVPDLRGCSDCPNCLSCQTMGKPGKQEWFWYEKEPKVLLSADMLKTAGFDVIKIKIKMMQDNAGAYTYTEVTTPIGVNSTYVKNCARPLGIGRRTLVSVEERHDYLWHSPCVPLKVKLIVACELADKLLEQTESSNDQNWSPTGGINTNVLSSDINAMIHESRETFEAWGLARVPTLVQNRDDRVWNAVNNTRLLRHVTARGCLVELFLAFRQNLVDMGVRGSKEGIKGCRYTQYENLVNRCCEISSQFAGGSGEQEGGWGGWSRQEKIKQRDSNKTRFKELLQQRIDRMLELIKKGTDDSEEAKEVSKI